MIKDNYQTDYLILKSFLIFEMTSTYFLITTNKRLSNLTIFVVSKDYKFNKMKSVKITYYATTGSISLAMVFSALAYLTSPDLKQAFQHSGFPDCFRIELAIAKGMAAIALWLPVRLFKEAAYIGLSISFVSAFIAHVAVGDPLSMYLNPLIVFAILVVSFVTHNKLFTEVSVKSL